MKGDRRLKWIFAAILVVGIAVYAGNRWQGEEEARTIYDSFIVACHRNNPVREGLYRFSSAAATVRAEAAEDDEAAVDRHRDEKAADEYQDVADELLLAPHVRTEGPRVGSTKCEEAIPSP